MFYFTQTSSSIGHPTHCRDTAHWKLHVPVQPILTKLTNQPTMHFVWCFLSLFCYCCSAFLLISPQFFHHSDLQFFAACIFMGNWPVIVYLAYSDIIHIHFSPSLLPYHGSVLSHEEVSVLAFCVTSLRVCASTAMLYYNNIVITCPGYNQFYCILLASSSSNLPLGRVVACMTEKEWWPWIRTRSYLGTQSTLFYFVCAYMLLLVKKTAEISFHKMTQMRHSLFEK